MMRLFGRLFGNSAADRFVVSWYLGERGPIIRTVYHIHGNEKEEMNEEIVGVWVCQRCGARLEMSGRRIEGDIVSQFAGAIRDRFNLFRVEEGDRWLAKSVNELMSDFFTEHRIFVNFPNADNLLNLVVRCMQLWYLFKRKK